MERYYKRKPKSGSSSPSHDECSKQSRLSNDLPDLPEDPALRCRIEDYNPNIRYQVRRAYLRRGPCQPGNHSFPQRIFGQSSRRFNPSWFNEFGSWLEYSISKDAAFCLCCYLFRPVIGDQGGAKSFVSDGFTNWKKKEKFRIHEGGVGHKQAWRTCQELLSQEEHVQTQTVCSERSDEGKNYYTILLNASVGCMRFLIRQGMLFLEHEDFEQSGDEGFEQSGEEGNFVDLLKLISGINKDVNAAVLKNDPGKIKLIAPDIVKASAIETANAIIRELGDGLFSILFDYRNIARDERLVVALRYVDKKGYVVEHLLGIKQVTSTSALSLKKEIEDLFSTHGLSISRLRGLSYDGYRGMHNTFKSLKTLISEENECAFYVHCFAQQLELALVGVASNHLPVANIFSLISKLVGIIGARCKSRDILQEERAAKVIQALKINEITSEPVITPENTSLHASDALWGSHYGVLPGLISVFSDVLDVLEDIEENGSFYSHPYGRGHASNILELIPSFEFAFHLHLMRSVFEITNDLAQAIQRKDQGIVDAISLVQVSKQQLQMMRDNGWGALMDEVTFFCRRHSIDVPNMDDVYSDRWRSRLPEKEITYSHYYRFESFNNVIDIVLEELNNRFNEVNSELLLCVACLNPSESFAAFDKQRLVRFAQFYPKDLTASEVLALPYQLENFIVDMRSCVEFADLKGINDLAQKMVETKRHEIHFLVYRLITFALILPVATTTVEMNFFAIKIFKEQLFHRMGEPYMNDSLVLYIERDIFSSIPVEAITHRFQNMRSRWGHL